jgi:hypothetical protein
MRSAPAVLFSFAASLFGQQPPGVPPAPSAAWQAFVRTHEPGFRAEWCCATGTPYAIVGPGLRVSTEPIRSLDAARERAEHVLDAHGALLGRGESSFVERIAVTVGRLHVLVYDQHWRGLRVVGGRADVRVHERGVVSMFGSRAVPIPNGFTATPTIDADLARALARDHLGLTDGAAAPELVRPDPAELVVWADTSSSTPTEPRLAWAVDVDERAGRLVVGTVFVDARRGTVLHHRDDVHACGHGTTGEPPPAPPADLVGNVKAWTNTGLAATDPLTLVPLARVRVTAAGVGSAFTDQNGDFTIPYSGSAPVALTVEPIGRHLGTMWPSQGTAVKATLQATPGAPTNVQLLTGSAGQFDRAQTTTYWWTDRGNEFVRAIVGNAPQMGWIDSVVATVNIAATCNAFYTRNSINFYAAGGGCSNTAFSTVVLHEWGHGLDDAFGSISQVDGLSEGWGDTVAMFVSGDPVVGRGFSTNGGSVRTGLNTHTYPAGGGVHRMGETWMGFCWDVRRNLQASLGAAGIAIAERIVIGSIVANAINQPDAVREVFLLDDDDGNLQNGTPHYAELSAAALKRTLPFPEQQLGVITHAPLVSTDVQLAPRIVRAELVPYGGTFTRTDLAWNAGSGIQRRALIPTGAGSAHVALLPGVLSPTPVAYWIEATHSTGPTLRFPATGDLRYDTGRLEEFWREDFENGVNGWTHTTTRVDDWQLGTPIGASGSKYGFAWQDPAVAVSGAAIWGNNLQGAYEVYGTNTLQAPTLDLRGRTNVRLRFWRWLGVAPIDIASILLNGQTVAADSGVSERAWSLREVRLAAADNNPSVTLAWRLDSTFLDTASGWNLDDVTLVTFAPAPPPPVQLTVSPDQIPLAGSSTLTLRGTPNAPVLLALGDSPGPTVIPGLPRLEVGGNLLTVAASLDGTGTLQVGFQAPASPAATGRLTWLHAIELSGPGTLTPSNPAVVLFGR